MPETLYFAVGNPIGIRTPDFLIQSTEISLLVKSDKALKQ